MKKNSLEQGHNNKKIKNREFTKASEKRKVKTCNRNRETKRPYSGAKKSINFDKTTFFAVFFRISPVL